LRTIEKIITQDYEFYEALNKILRNLARHSSSLLQDVDSNIVESFNSIIAKFIGVKRINYALKNSYYTRCMLATISKNNKRPIYSLHKALYKKSPFKKSNFKALEILRKEKHKKDKTNPDPKLNDFGNNYLKTIIWIFHTGLMQVNRYERRRVF